MPDLSPHALLSTAEMGAADAATIASGRFSGIALMEAAGAAIADVALARFGAAEQVHVLCGPGNNGGDGYVVARLLAERGVPVRLYALAPPKARTDAALAADAWRGPVEPLDAFEPAADALVIDALFGAGFAAALPTAAAQALQSAQSVGASILAVDLPSGVNGDTGQGADAVPCDATATFYRRKPGHLLEPGKSLCGPVIVADIGVRADAPVRAFANHPDLWAAQLPRHAVTTHKYARGAVAVLSGPLLGTGAARLAAMAAQRAGAGAVTILGDPDALAIHACHVTSIMLRSTGEGAMDALGSLKGIGAVVLGPGFGDLQVARALTLDILNRTSSTLVLDADGITAFAEAPDALFAAGAKAPSRLVLTPHGGEFARLFPEIAGDASIGKLDKARAAAARSGAIVLYKGPDTVIAAPDGRAAINENATAALATAGSGDVLAGVIVALSAQGMPAFEASCAGAYLHADAGRAAGPLAIAEDLAPAAAEALRPLVEGGF